jgi:hypothetical protein
MHQLGSFDLRTFENRVLAKNASARLVFNSNVSFLAASEVLGFRGLAVHEDRLYFGDGPTIDSMRLDRSDRRQLGVRDHEIGSGNHITGELFRSLSGVGGSGPRGLAVRDERLAWVKEGAFWQIELATGDGSRLSGELPESVNAMTMTMTMTDEAIYWIDDRRVWRWKFGGDEFESLYELGDTRYDAISAVGAGLRPTVIWNKGSVGVTAADRGVYQLLFSGDLQSWSPDYVGSNLFNRHGTLSWLSPRLAIDGEALIWKPTLETREAYFTAWQYDLGAPFDWDGEELPDYWERRHFKNWVFCKICG